MNRTRYLALDFDGVIADSIEECLIVGCNAYAEFRQLSGTNLSSIMSLTARDIREFKRLRNFIRSGEDYVYIRMAMVEGVKIKRQEDFDTFLQENRALKEKFFALFYHERERLSKDSPDTWLSLNPLYPGMQSFMQTHADRENFSILSTKKSSFIRMILSRNGIDLPQERIFHAGSGRTKREIISSLIEEREIAPADFSFVDDQVDTLLKIQPVGIRLYHAGWGYNNLKQRKRAMAAGIAVLTLEEFYNRF